MPDPELAPPQAVLVPPFVADGLAALGPPPVTAATPCGVAASAWPVAGRVVAVGPAELVVVEWSGVATTARSTVEVATDDVGREALITFERGDPSRPIVIGLIGGTARTAPPIAVDCDGGRLVIRADREVVLQCGDACVTLTRSGKILIRGTYLSTRSTGATRIKGGSVQIN
jgi:hypothetical protein